MASDRGRSAGLTVATWTLAAVLYLVPYYFLQLGEGVTGRLIIQVINLCVGGALISAGLPVVARRIREGSAAARFAVMGAAVVAGSFALAAYDLASNRVLLNPLFGVHESGALMLQQAMVNFVSVLWPFALLAAACSIVEGQTLARERERELATARESASRAEAAAAAAQLALLRYQLNPHFLFNTLNAISSLIVTERMADADMMTRKLSGFLRATLEGDPALEVTLDQELETVQAYLEVEGVRFGERLNIAFECPAALLDALVPSFVLQPLVENAIKYAVAPSRRTVTITVRAALDRDTLAITVEDDGRQAFGSLPKSGTGVGLANVRGRLSAFYGEDGVLETTATERGFLVTLRLPIRREAEARVGEA